MPNYAMVFMVLTLANVGLPGTSGFIGNFSRLLVFFRLNPFMQSLVLLELYFQPAMVFDVQKGHLGRTYKREFKKNKRSFFKRKILPLPSSFVNHNFWYLSKTNYRNLQCNRC